MEKVRATGRAGGFHQTAFHGPLRELENQFSPRDKTWDLMLQVTGAPGIHFEDHPELAGFECPEWSHLTAQDAVSFTQALLPHIAKALSGS